MKKILFIILACSLSQSLFSQDKVEGNKYVAYLNNACKGDFSSFFYKELDFKKDTVAISDFHTRDNEPEGIKHYTKSIKYKYSIKNKNILIEGSEIKNIQIQEHSLKTDRNVIFTEVNLKLNGKKYAGCHGQSCHKVIGGGYMSSDCLFFDFSEKTVAITSYQKRSDLDGKHNQITNVYSYKEENNSIHIENFTYKTFLIDGNHIIAKESSNNEELENLVFDEIKP